MEIVQEEGNHPTPSVPTTTQRTRALSSASEPVADDSDDELLMPVTSQQYPLETEDDDEPLLQFDETGVSGQSSERTLSLT